MAFIDDARRLLNQMKGQYNLAGDRDICFARYNPPQADPLNEEQKLEYHYAEMVNRNAGKVVKLSDIIAQLEVVIQSG